MPALQVDHLIAMRHLIEPEVNLLFHGYALLWYVLEVDEEAGALLPVSAACETRCMSESEPRPRPAPTTFAESLVEDDNSFICALPEEEDDRLQLEKDWSDHIEDVGVDMVLGIDGAHGRLRYLQWGIENGVLPGQPFLVYLEKPHYYKSSYEYNEWDVDVESALVGRLPFSGDLRVVEQLLDWAAQDEANLAEHRELTRTAQRLDVDRMFISVRWYYATSGWDDMAVPDGVSYSLSTTRVSVDSRVQGWGGYLATGRSDKGDCAEAMQKLREVVAREFPNVTERLDSLPVRRQ